MYSYYGNISVYFLNGRSGRRRCERGVVQMGMDVVGLGTF